MFISLTNKQESCLLIKTVTQTGLLRQEKFGYAVQIKQNCGRCNISEEMCKKIKVVNSDLCSRYQKVSIFIQP